MKIYCYKAKNGNYQVWKDAEENAWELRVVHYDLISIFNEAGFKLKREAINYAKEILEVTE